MKRLNIYALKHLSLLPIFKVRIRRMRRTWRTRRIWWIRRTRRIRRIQRTRQIW